MHKTRRLFIGLWLITLLFSARHGFAQKDEVWGSWFLGYVEYSFSPKLFTYIEVQDRNQSLFRHFNYYEIKGGIGYRFYDNFSALFGFGNYNTYDWEDLSAPKITEEWRIWEQFIMVQNLQRLRFEHRFRAEQALISGKYRNRFRYRLNLTAALNKRKIEKGALYFSVFNEIFLTNNAPYFMRNRFYAGLGYQLSNSLGMGLGWVNQFNYNLKAAGGKNSLMLSVTLRLSRK